LKTNTLEKDIQRAICDYLAYSRHFFYRNNNTPMFDTKRGMFRAMPKYTPHGLPDIVVVKDGKYIGLEVKREKGQVSKEQTETGKRIVSAGGEWHVVRSIDDVQKLGL
jgi:hypothetical protein